MVTDTKIKKGYKQTELGLIPEDWEVKKLGDVAEVVGGCTPSTYTPNYWNGMINWFTPTEIGLNKYTYSSLRQITEEGLKNCSAKILPKGTILLTTRAGIGDVSILMNEGCTNQGFQSLIANNDVNHEFLYYLVSTLKSVLIKNASGSTFLEISPNRIKQIEVKIPTLKEQTAIVTVLSDTDALIEHLEKLIAKKKAIKQGTMQQLLTCKKRLPGFSGEWGEKKLRDIANFVKGRGLSKSKICIDGNYSCILYGELFTTYSQVIKEVKSKTNSREGLSSAIGDILMPGSTTTVGIDLATASVLQQNNVLLGGDLIVIRKKESNNYNSEFLANYLTHISKYKIAEISQGITIIHLHGSRLQEISVKIPSDIKEQTAIATILSDMDAEIESLEQKRDKYTMLKQGMMQELLIGKTRLV